MLLRLARAQPMTDKMATEILEKAKGLEVNIKVKKDVLEAYQKFYAERLALVVLQKVQKKLGFDKTEL